MSAVMSRAEARAARAAELDPTLASTLETLLDGSPQDQAESMRAGVAAFCAWIERAGTEFSGYDEAFAAYEKAVDGTPAAGTLPFVQLLLVALDERSGEQEGRGAHAAA